MIPLRDFRELRPGGDARLGGRPRRAFRFPREPAVRRLRRALGAAAGGGAGRPRAGATLSGLPPYAVPMHDKILDLLRRGETGRGPRSKPGGPLPRRRRTPPPSASWRSCCSRPATMPPRARRSSARSSWRRTIPRPFRPGRPAVFREREHDAAQAARPQHRAGSEPVRGHHLIQARFRAGPRRPSTRGRSASAARRARRRPHPARRDRRDAGAAPGDGPGSRSRSSRPRCSGAGRAAVAVRARVRVHAGSDTWPSPNRRSARSSSACRRQPTCTR